MPRVPSPPYASNGDQRMGLFLWNVPYLFLILLPCYPLRRSLGIAPTHDHAAGALDFAGLVAFAHHAPRADRRLGGSRSTLATAVWMVNRVHRHTTHRRAHTAPAHASSLTNGFQRMFFITYFAQRCTAVHMHFANFTGAQA